jgi:hypothetical protein
MLSLPVSVRIFVARVSVVSLLDGVVGGVSDGFPVSVSRTA